MTVTSSCFVMSAKKGRMGCSAKRDSRVSSRRTGAPGWQRISKSVEGPFLARYHHHLLSSHASAFKGRLEVCGLQAILVFLGDLRFV